MSDARICCSGILSWTLCCLYEGSHLHRSNPSAFRWQSSASRRLVCQTSVCLWAAASQCISVRWRFAAQWAFGGCVPWHPRETTPPKCQHPCLNFHLAWVSRLNAVAAYNKPQFSWTLDLHAWTKQEKWQEILCL